MTACIGSCGSSAAEGRMACARCWNRLPLPIRTAIRTSTGPDRRLAIAGARAWFHLAAEDVSGVGSVGEETP